MVPWLIGEVSIEATGNDRLNNWRISRYAAARTVKCLIEMLSAFNQGNARSMVGTRLTATGQCRKMGELRQRQVHS